GRVRGSQVRRVPAPPRAAARGRGPVRPVLRWLAMAALVLCWVPEALAQQKLPLDPARSQFGFEIRTRFGQKISGVFPRFDGDILVLPDGRHQVRLRIYTDQVEIPGKPRYTAWMRGEDFFDVARYALVEFDSLPYVPPDYGQPRDIVGNLTMRGVTHLETLTVLPSECTRAGYDCDVISRGTVLRGRYGMDKWQVALGDRVTFVLRARFLEAPQP
ncbi:MAG: YceI family protein, partial [Pseudomonas sp.]